jgi:hypothetical protein
MLAKNAVVGQHGKLSTRPLSNDKAAASAAGLPHPMLLLRHDMAMQRHAEEWAFLEPSMGS